MDDLRPCWSDLVRLVFGWAGSATARVAPRVAGRFRSSLPPRRASTEPRFKMGHGRPRPPTVIPPLCALIRDGRGTSDSTTIGGRSAGSALASRLSADRTPILLEAGLLSAGGIPDVLGLACCWPVVEVGLDRHGGHRPPGVVELATPSTRGVARSRITSADGRGLSHRAPRMRARPRGRRRSRSGRRTGTSGTPAVLPPVGCRSW